MRKFDKIKESVRQFVRFGPPLIAGFIGIIYVANVLYNFNKDTTSITNAAFVIVSVLAALSLRVASVVFDEKLKDRFLYCGERFFHAAIFLILASILKYATLSIGHIAFFETRQLMLQIVTMPLSMLAQICFMYAVLDTHTGIRIANKQLWLRMHRAEDWDDIV